MGIEDKDYINMDAPEVRFLMNPALELAAAMYIFSNADRNLALSKEMKVMPDERLTEIGNRGAAGFSKFMQKELHFFMDQDTPNFTYTNPLNSLPFRLAMEYYQAGSVDEFIKCTEKMNLENFRGLMESGEVAGSLQTEGSNLREKLEECLENPLETKSRLILLLNQFYTKVFKPYEEELKGILTAAAENYEIRYKSDTAAFIKDFFRMEPSGLNCRVIYVHVSYFMQMGILRFIGNIGNHPDFVILGIYADRLFGKPVMKARLISFYKLLSDEKRFEMLELITEKPRYVNELAELLSIAPSTASHHLNRFLSAGLVKPVRDEHKLYYSLDKAKFSEMLDRSKKMFTGE